MIEESKQQNYQTFWLFVIFAGVIFFGSMITYKLSLKVENPPHVETPVHYTINMLEGSKLIFIDSTGKIKPLKQKQH